LLLVNIILILTIVIIWQIDRAKIALVQSQRDYWHEQYLFCRQSADTIRSIGDYHRPPINRPRNQVNLAYNERTDSIRIFDTTGGRSPVIEPLISFDTTRYFGREANPFGVRVAGEFHCDSTWRHDNWILIQPLGYRGPEPKPDCQKPSRTSRIFVSIGFSSRTTVVSMGIGDRLAPWIGAEFGRHTHTRAFIGIRLTF